MALRASGDWTASSRRLSSIRPSVLKLAVAVEDEDVRRGDDPERAGHGLCLAIGEVGIADLPVRGARLHVVQRFPDVAEREILQLQRGRLVRIDGDKRHAAIAIVGGELAEARFVELRGRTGVAGEDDREHLAAGIFAERVHLAVDAWQ